VTVSDLHPPWLRCTHSAEGRAREKKTVVVITLSIVMLAMMLAALGYVAFGTRKLDAHLQSLLHTQSEHRHEMERDVERLRQYYNRT
jgi:hypothetical protein